VVAVTSFVIPLLVEAAVCADSNRRICDVTTRLRLFGVTQVTLNELLPTFLNRAFSNSYKPVQINLVVYVRRRKLMSANIVIALGLFQMSQRQEILYLVNTVL
jgi:hypothetical protein